MRPICVVSEVASCSTPSAFECQNIEFTTSWSHKDSELRIQIQCLEEIDLPDSNKKFEGQFSKFLKDTMSSLVTAEKAVDKKMLRKALKRKYDHIIMAWGSIRPELFMPRKQGLTVDQKPITFQGEPKIVTMKIFEELRQNKVLCWKSVGEKLDKLEPGPKYICNIVKTYVNNRECALVIHKDQERECGEVGMQPHLHCIIIRSLENEDSCPSTDEELKHINKKVSKAGGTVTVQPIRSIFGFVDKMLAKPRLFLGTNNDTLLDIFKAVEGKKVSFLPISEEDCLGEVKEFTDFDPRLLEYNWSDDESGPSTSKEGCLRLPVKDTSRTKRRGSKRFVLQSSKEKPSSSGGGDKNAVSVLSDDEEEDIIVSITMRITSSIIYLRQK